MSHFKKVWQFLRLSQMRKVAATFSIVITQNEEAAHERWMIQRRFWFLFSLILTTDVEEETLHLLGLFTTTRPHNARVPSENDDWLQLPVGGQSIRLCYATLSKSWSSTTGVLYPSWKEKLISIRNSVFRNKPVLLYFFPLTEVSIFMETQN